LNYIAGRQRATILPEIAEIPADKWVSWKNRPSRDAGETLTSIGKKYHVTPAAIAARHNLEQGAALGAGEKLIIPATQAQAEIKRRLVSYRVRRRLTHSRHRGPLRGKRRRFAQVEPLEIQSRQSRHGSANYSLGAARKPRPAASAV